MPITRSDDPELQALLTGQTQILQAIQALQPSQSPPVTYQLITAAYTVSQSSVYPGLTGTFANLTDELGDTGAATNSTANEWIRATFATAQNVRAVRVGGGNLPGWGGVALYLNARSIQYSTDGTNWLTAASISGIEDTLPNQYRLIALAQPISARFWRIWSNSWLATTDLRFFS